MPDLTNPAAIGLLAICNGSAAIRSLCARTTNCAVAWGSLRLGDEPNADALPILAVEDTGQSNDAEIENDQLVTFVLAAFAAGPEADTVAGQLLSAAESAITNQAMQAQGLNAGIHPPDYPWPRDRVDVTDKGIDHLVQRTMTLTFLISPE